MPQSQATPVPPARLSKRERRQRANARRRLLVRLLGGAAAVAFLALVGYGAWNLFRPKLGEVIPEQARTHIQADDPHEPYNSDPPTSGAHAAPAREGFYDTTPPDENLVHNLEHGYIVIWYDCSSLGDSGCQSLKGQIRAVMDSAPSVAVFGGAKKLIAAPRQGMDTVLALTSWGRRYALESFDEMNVLQFIKDFRGQAPEGGAP